MITRSKVVIYKPKVYILLYNLNLLMKLYKTKIGFYQVASFDFNEMFSPMVKPTTIRVILLIAVARNWVVKPFFNGDLQEEVYML